MMTVNIINIFTRRSRQGQSCPPANVAPGEIGLIPAVDLSLIVILLHLIMDNPSMLLSMDNLFPWMPDPISSYLLKVISPAIVPFLSCITLFFAPSLLDH